MDQHRFDQIVRAVAEDASRRTLLQRVSGGGVAALLVALALGGTDPNVAEARKSCAQQCKNKNSKKKRKACRKKCKKDRGPACRSVQDCGDGFQCIGAGKNRFCCPNGNLCGSGDLEHMECCGPDRCIEDVVCCPEGFTGCGFSCCDTAVTLCTVDDFCCLKDFVCGTDENAECCINGTCDNGVCTRNPESIAPTR